MLRLLVNIVPNSVVPATPDAVVVPTMHSVVAFFVVVFVAVVGSARPRRKER